MTEDNGYDVSKLLCCYHYVVIFLDDGTIELSDRVRISDKINDVFKNLVTAATVLGKPDEWCVYEEITFKDGIIHRLPIVSGYFENFVNDESYSLFVSM